MTIQYKGMNFANNSQGAEMLVKGQLELLDKHIKDIRKRDSELTKATDVTLGLAPFSKDEDKTAIRSDMTAAQINRAIDETRKKYGKKHHGLYNTLKTEHGWFIVALFKSGDFWEHWNYHPGRKSLALTHTTPWHASDKLYQEFDNTLACLQRLYKELST